MSEDQNTFRPSYLAGWEPVPGKWRWFSRGGEEKYEGDIAREFGERPFVGRAVSRGEVRFLSVSQITAFDASEEGGCPARWGYRYIDGIKEEKTDALRFGDEVAKVLASYLKTGQDNLPPILRAGKHLLPVPGPDLEVEEDLAPDILRAIDLRRAILTGRAPDNLSNRLKIQEYAGLTAAGVPLIGAADFRHRRGEFVSQGGDILREDPGIVVAEIGDHKTTKQISDHRSRGGVVYPGYAKTPEQVAEHPQMLGYGVHAALKWPFITHVRLSHIYYQKKGTPDAAKRSKLVTVEWVRRRYEARVEGVVREIVDAARAKSGAELPKNTRACHSYGKDCPHIAYCDRPERSITDLFTDPLTKRQGAAMGSLFDDLTKKNGAPPQGGSLFAPSAPPPLPSAPPQGSLFGSAPSAPPPPPLPSAPPLTEAQRAAAVEEEKARLRSETASLGTCQCGAQLTPLNSSRLQDGHTLKHIGCALSSPPPAPPPIGAINPADAPPIDPVRAAAPLKPETIAQIEHPDMRARAQLHASEAAERAAIEAPKKEAKTGGRCAGSETRKLMTKKELMSSVRKASCPICAKEFKLKDKDMAIEGDDVYAVFPRHNTPKAEEGAVAVVSAPPPPHPLQNAVPPLPPPFPVEVPPLPLSAGAPPLPASVSAPPPLPPSAEDFAQQRAPELKRQFLLAYEHFEHFKQAYRQLSIVAQALGLIPTDE